MREDTTGGRVLLASLHQAIAEVLPARLELYERWLTPGGAGEDPIAAAPFTAMLASLQQEGDALDAVAAGAGRHAAVRSFRRLPLLRRAGLRALPQRIRAGKIVRLAAEMLPELYPDSRVDMTRRGGTLFINIDGSPFCAARRTDDQPSCGFYVSVLTTFLQLFHIRAAVKVSRCRASGSKSCLLMVLTAPSRAAADSPVSGLEHGNAPSGIAAPGPEVPAEPPTPALEPPPVVAPSRHAPPGLTLLVRRKPGVVATEDQDGEAPWHRL